MGKRKTRKSCDAAAAAAKKKARTTLPSRFECPFCNHRGAVSCNLQRDEGRATVACSHCRMSYTTRCRALTEAVDVYHEWIDACEDTLHQQQQQQMQENELAARLGPAAVAAAVAAGAAGGGPRRHPAAATGGAAGGAAGGTKPSGLFAASPQGTAGAAHLLDTAPRAGQTGLRRLVRTQQQQPPQGQQVQEDDAAGLAALEDIEEEEGVDVPSGGDEHGQLDVEEASPIRRHRYHHRQPQHQQPLQGGSLREQHHQQQLDAAAGTHNPTSTVSNRYKSSTPGDEPPGDDGGRLGRVSTLVRRRLVVQGAGGGAAGAGAGVGAGLSPASAVGRGGGAVAAALGGEAPGKKVRQTELQRQSAAMRSFMDTDDGKDNDEEVAGDAGPGQNGMAGRPGGEEGGVQLPSVDEAWAAGEQGMEEGVRGGGLEYGGVTAVGPPGGDRATVGMSSGAYG